MSKILSRVTVVALLLFATTGCLVYDLKRLASDEMGGRRSGTEGGDKAVEFLVRRLQSSTEGAFSGQTGAAAYRQDFPGGTNVVGIVRGTELPDEYVVLGAHWDHLGSDCYGVSPEDDICNGATDNATGTAAVLEIADRLAADPPRRSVVVALWDREEVDFGGSKHYVANPPVPLADTVAYVNLDILGANLLPSLRSSSFAVASETGGPVLESIVRDAIDETPLDLATFSSIFGLYRSDYATFISAQVPSVFFTDSTGPCYHTVHDEVEVVDVPKLRRQVDVVEQVTRDLAATEVRPSFTTGLPLATYHDAVTLLSLIERAQVDQDRFPAAEQASIEDSRQVVGQLVSEGPAEFSNDDMISLLGHAAEVVDILTYGECDGFLTD